MLAIEAEREQCCARDCERIMQAVRVRVKAEGKGTIKLILLELLVSAVLAPAQARQEEELEPKGSNPRGQFGDTQSQKDKKNS